MWLARDKASVAYRFLRRPIRRGFQSFRSLKADSGFHCRSALVSVVFVDEKMAVKENKNKLEQLLMLLCIGAIHLFMM